MAPWTILIAEDEQLLRMILVDALAELQAEILQAADGAAALMLALERRPDMILLDIMMPKMDGFEVAKALKSNPRTQEIPFIFLTSLEATEERLRGLKLGAEDYITKPFHPVELLTRVRNVLHRIQEAKKAKTFHGTLRDMSLPTLVQFLEGEGKSGVLSITSGERSGKIFVEQGKIVGAEVGRLRGEKAVHRLLRWEEGEFTLEPPADAVPAPLIIGSSQSVIMEGMRCVDEFEKILSTLPPLSTYLRLRPETCQSLEAALSPGAGEFLGLFDGAHTLGEIFDRSPWDDLTTAEVVARIHTRGLFGG